MGKPLGGVAGDLALSRFPDHAAITWSDPQATYFRITTRSPPSDGTLAEIPLGRELYDKFAKKAFEQCARNSQGSWKGRNDWYEDDHKQESDHGDAAPSGRDSLADHEPKSPSSVHGHSEPAITTPTEQQQPHWLCDQGCCNSDDWEEGDTAKPINRSRAKCKKRTDLIRTVHAQCDPEQRELTPSEAAMMPSEVGDLDRDLDIANNLPESTENVADREATKPPAERTTSPSAVSIAPPSNRVAPTVRPVRPIR